MKLEDALLNVWEVTKGIGKGTAYCVSKGGNKLKATMLTTALAGAASVLISSINTSFQAGNKENMTEIGKNMFDDIF